MNRLYPHYGVDDFVELGLEEALKECPTFARFRGIMLDEIRRESRRYRLAREKRTGRTECTTLFEHRSDLDRALGGLQRRERDVLLSVHVLGYEAQEVAKRWGVHKSRATRVLQRAMGKARDTWEE